jgi:hypothetical protein
MYMKGIPHEYTSYQYLYYVIVAGNIFHYTWMLQVGTPSPLITDYPPYSHHISRRCLPFIRLPAHRLHCPYTPRHVRSSL